MHHGRVVSPAKFSSDFRQGSRRQLLCQIHRDLARAGHGAGATRRVHFRQANVEMLRDAFLNLFDRDLAVIRAQHVMQHVLRCLECNWSSNQVRIGDNAV